MKLKDVREAYYFHTAKLSDVVRQLSLAGVGLIWIFRTETGKNSQEVPEALIRAAACIFLSLAFDLLHYATSAITWGLYNRRKEKSVSEEQEFKAPVWFNRIPIGLVIAKTVAMAVAYIWFILPYLFRRFAAF